MNALRVVAACLVMTVWAIAYLAPYFKADAPPASPELSALMLMVVAWLLGSAVRDARHKIGESLRDAADRLTAEKDDSDNATRPQPDDEGTGADV